MANVLPKMAFETQPNLGVYFHRWGVWGDASLETSMTTQTSGLTIRRGSSNTLDRTEELKAAVLERRLIVYVDEWTNRRTLEARVYGVTRGERPVLVGFQLDADYGVVPEKLWKVIDDLDRLIVRMEAYETVERTLPAQYTSQIVRFDAISPDTALDLTKYEATGY